MSNFYIGGYIEVMVKLKKLIRCTKNPGWYNFTGKKYQFSQKLPLVPFSGNLFFTVRIWQEINAALSYAKA